MLCIYLHIVYRFLETHIKLLSFVCFLMSGTRYDIDLLFRVEKIDTDSYNSVDRGIEESSASSSGENGLSLGSVLVHQFLQYDIT